MKSKVIYLQTGFWKQLTADISIEGLQCLMNVYEAISEANLRTDIEDELWDTDPFLKLLWKKFVSNQADIDLFERIVIEAPEENVEDLSAIYLTTNDSVKCEIFNTNYGVVAINNKDMLKRKHMFRGCGFMLIKNRIQYKDRYAQFKDIIFYPCNAMIIIDPYILSKEENIENSLSPLLDTMLPDKKLKVQFQISIFSMIGEKNKDYSKISDFYTQIENIIKALRKGLGFDMTIYAIGSSEDFHSRMIITNNVLLSAADGFDVFRKNYSSNKNAKFDIVLPRLLGDSRQDMSNYLRWIKIAKNRSMSQSKTQFWGSRINRLFDLVN